MCTADRSLYAPSQTGCTRSSPTPAVLGPHEPRIMSAEINLYRFLLVEPLSKPISAMRRIDVSIVCKANAALMRLSYLRCLLAPCAQAAGMHITLIASALTWGNEYALDSVAYATAVHTIFMC